MQPPIPNPQGPYSPQNQGPLSAEERNWAMACHLAGFAGYLLPGIGHILGPLVVWLIKKDTSPFIDDQGKEALNFNISVTIWALVCFLLGITIIGLVIAIPFGLVLMVVDVVCKIIGAIRASNGERYRYPMTIRLVN